MENFTRQKVGAAFEKIRLPESTHHVFLCCGPDCCSMTDGLATWEVLKRETAALPVKVLRTKAACLRICSGGPWMVVYPDGVWYGEVTPERCLRIVREHLGENRPVTDWISAIHPLQGRTDIDRVNG